MDFVGEIIHVLQHTERFDCEHQTVIFPTGELPSIGELSDANGRPPGFLSVEVIL